MVAVGGEAVGGGQQELACLGRELLGQVDAAQVHLGLHVGRIQTQDLLVDCDRLGVVAGGAELGGDLAVVADGLGATPLPGEQVAHAVEGEQVVRGVFRELRELGEGGVDLALLQ